MKSRIIFPILTVGLFVLLVSVAVFRLFYQTKVETDQLIAQEVKELVLIIKKIDDRCKILSFDYQKNPINFLNVEKFTGSEVGSMNLTYPDRWEGPYLFDNPTIQGKEYQIVKTKRGYFITPADGVYLGNGKVVGKDIILDENADIDAMMADDNALRSDGEALAAPLPIGSSGIQDLLLENILRAEEGLVFYNKFSNIKFTADW